MPPPVEPAQLPMSMSSSSTSWESTGHWAKSTVAKPVVDMMELTWNSAWRSDRPTLWKLAKISTAMMQTEAATMMPNQRSSSLRSASRTRPIRIR